MDLNDYIPALRYGAKIPTDANDISLTEHYMLVGNSSGDATGVTMKEDAVVYSSGSVKISNGIPFIATYSAGTATWNVGLGKPTVLADSYVTLGRSAYVTGFSIANIAAVEVLTTPILLIQDTANVTLWTVPIIVLGVNNTANSTGSTSFGSSTYCGTAGKGIRVAMSGGSLACAGATGGMSVVVWGLIK